MRRRHRQHGAAAPLPHAIRKPNLASHTPLTVPFCLHDPQLTEETLKRMRCPPCKPDRSKPDIELLRLLSAAGLKVFGPFVVPAAHKMTEAQSRKEMEAVGLKWKSTDSKLLPWQHFMVFEKPEKK